MTYKLTSVVFRVGLVVLICVMGGELEAQSKKYQETFSPNLPIRIEIEINHNTSAETNPDTLMIFGNIEDIAREGLILEPIFSNKTGFNKIIVTSTINNSEVEQLSEKKAIEFEDKSLGKDESSLIRLKINPNRANSEIAGYLFFEIKIGESLIQYGIFYKFAKPGHLVLDRARMVNLSDQTNIITIKTSKNKNKEESVYFKNEGDEPIMVAFVPGFELPNPNCPLFFEETKFEIKAGETVEQKIKFVWKNIKPNNKCFDYEINSEFLNPKDNGKIDLFSTKNAPTVKFKIKNGSNESEVSFRINVQYENNFSSFGEKYFIAMVVAFILALVLIIHFALKVFLKTDVLKIIILKLKDNKAQNQHLAIIQYIKEDFKYELDNSNEFKDYHERIKSIRKHYELSAPSVKAGKFKLAVKDLPYAIGLLDNVLAFQNQPDSNAKELLRALAQSDQNAAQKIHKIIEETENKSGTQGQNRGATTTQGATQPSPQPSGEINDQGSSRSQQPPSPNSGQSVSPSPSPNTNIDHEQIITEFLSRILKNIGGPISSESIAKWKEKLPIIFEALTKLLRTRLHLPQDRVYPDHFEKGIGDLDEKINSLEEKGKKLEEKEAELSRLQKEFGNLKSTLNLNSNASLEEIKQKIVEKDELVKKKNVEIKQLGEEKDREIKQLNESQAELNRFQRLITEQLEVPYSKSIDKNHERIQYLRAIPNRLGITLQTLDIDPNLAATLPDLSKIEHQVDQRIKRLNQIADQWPASFQTINNMLHLLQTNLHTIYQRMPKDSPFLQLVSFIISGEKGGSGLQRATEILNDEKKLLGLWNLQSARGLHDVKPEQIYKDFILPYCIKDVVDHLSALYHYQYLKTDNYDLRSDMKSSGISIELLSTMYFGMVFALEQSIGLVLSIEPSLYLGESQFDPNLHRESHSANITRYGNNRYVGLLNELPRGVIYDLIEVGYSLESKTMPEKRKALVAIK